LRQDEERDKTDDAPMRVTPAPDWTDVNRSDPGITMPQLFAFLGERLSFSLERRRYLFVIAVAALAVVGFVWRHRR